jgi:hypothetical protein
MAIYLVGALAMILFALGALLSFRSAFNISSQRRVKQSLESRHLAEAGVQRALHLMRHGHTALSDSFEYGGGKVAVTFAPGTGALGEPLIEVLSRGTFLELTTLLSAQVELDPVFLRSQPESHASTGPDRGQDGPTSDLDLSGAATPTSPAAGRGLHVTLVKVIATVTEEAKTPADLTSAHRQLVERIRKANTRYVESLSGLTRADLRWNLFGLAAAVASAEPGASRQGVERPRTP